MNRIIMLIILCGLFLSTTVQGQESLLWQITGNGISNPSYIYGTIHLMCPDDYEFPEKLNTVLEETKSVVFEVDFTDEKGNAELLKNMMAIEKPISEFLSETEEHLLDSFLLKKAGFPLAIVDNMKPSGLLMQLAMVHFTCSTTDLKSYDKDINTVAKAKGLNILFLETLQEQWETLDFLPDNEEVEQIMEMVVDHNDDEREFELLMEAYKKENLSALDSLIKLEMTSEKQLDALLFNRNLKWIKPIKNQISKESTLIAVGAGHLSSDKGVLHLLEKEGYILKPVF